MRLNSTTKVSATGKMVSQISIFVHAEADRLMYPQDPMRYATAL